MLKREIEQQLAARIPSALSPQVQAEPRLLPVGIAAIDALLGGGLPLGAITECFGPPSSGRTSLAMSLLRSGTEDAACAYVDVSNAFCPVSAAAAGVRLNNLLWVRFAEPEKPMPTMPRPAMEEVPALPIETPRKARESVQQNCGGPHPRGETKGLPEALANMLDQKSAARKHKCEGTPGYPNQRIGALLKPSDEQLAWERCNSRRTDAGDPLRQNDLAAAAEARMRAGAAHRAEDKRAHAATPWKRLDRAIRAADQVLQSGGFRVVVLDLADTPVEQALRIPSATWFRFRRAAQESDAALLLLTASTCAQSSAGCVLECFPGMLPRPQVPDGRVLSQIAQRVEVSRQRKSSVPGKKAPGRETGWSASPAWMRAVGK